MKRFLLIPLCAMLVFTSCNNDSGSNFEIENETVVGKELDDTENEDIYDEEALKNETEDIVDDEIDNNEIDNDEIDNNEDEYIPEEQTEEQKAQPVQPEKTVDGIGFNDSKSWWFRRNAEHIPPTAQQEINISWYDAYYIGDTSEKIIYLTFDEGYEAGYSGQILDVLKDNDVKATFFVTGHYLNTQPELVKRMAEEGHIVGNHSFNHLDHTTVTDEEMVDDIESCQKLITETVGYEMPKFFRPPAGVYSIRTLEKAQELGYKTIFWSFAYKDWDTNAQPTTEEAYDMVMTNYHNGCIMLLHAVSEANTNALDSMIKSLKQEGYEFRSLMELP